MYTGRPGKLQEILLIKTLTVILREGGIIKTLIANYKESEEHQITPEKFNQRSLILNLMDSYFLIQPKGD